MFKELIGGILNPVKGIQEVGKFTKETFDYAFDLEDDGENNEELMITLDEIETTLKNHKTFSPKTHIQFTFKGEKWELVKLADKE